MMVKIMNKIFKRLIFHKVLGSSEAMMFQISYCQSTAVIVTSLY